MTLSTFEEFRTRKLAEGFDEVLERRWEARTVLEEHTHPFDANAVVADGEMWLQVGTGPARRLLPGDTFELARGTPHSERYGEAGATYWVARRG
ncbi:MULTISPECIES: AraC family transcriptional regulator [Ramlibacter]|uniref:AraC family transcriptional regulator n=1 Tax=Ramlibacter aquaticus TaxID=2780094 RepID=A0ABR9SGV9_9BURK|nr:MULTISPECIES: AraC family transcriptional regulator [Ramlibacter]MBE7941287.1 AraC family transcriptional regulator [Ramlibacter aquaticus]